MPCPEYSEMAKALLWYIYHIVGEPYSTTPKNTYRPLGNIFALSEKEITRPRPDGYSGSDRENKVQWTRQLLINEGFLDGRVRGVWSLTESGIFRAKKISVLFEKQ